MRWAQLRRSLRSSSIRLAATYLLIIMIMSLGFSLVFYNTSAHQLGRQIPPDSLINNQPTSTNSSNNTVATPLPRMHDDQNNQQLNQFLHQRIEEGRRALLKRLIILNIAALLIGSVVSYVLARRSLRPIEAAMNAQAQFVSDASHELRTPLTAIQTSNEVFLRKPKLRLEEPAHQLILQNVEDVKRLKTLTDSLLQLSHRAHESKPLLKPVAVQDVVSEALNQIVNQATAKNITLHDDLGKVMVRADSTGLAQVFIILLDNAVKYSHADGNIYLTSSTRGKHAFINIRDEGIGIRASDLPHLFRRFYRADVARTHNGAAGYGLGLAIAKQIIENHFGTITVDSTPDAGSTFTLKLPLA